MDTHETYGPIQPARATLPATPPRPAPVESHASPINLGTAIRAVARHWWQILILWVVGTAAAMFVIQAKVIPKYRVTGVLRVLPANDRLFEGGQGTEALELFMETQVKLLTSSKIISDVLSDPKISGLERVRKAEDPEADLIGALSASVLPKTSLIALSMTSPKPEEAAKIVNAVMRNYLESSQEFASRSTKDSIKKLEEYKNTLEFAKAGIGGKIKDLLAKGNVDAAALDRPQQQPKEGAPVEAAEPRSTRRVTVEEYAKQRSDIFDTELKIIQAKTTLDSLLARAESEAVTEAALSKDPERAGAAVSHMEQVVATKLYNDPLLDKLKQETEKAWELFGKAQAVARNENDASLVVLKNKYNKSKKNYVDAMKVRTAQIRHELASDGRGGRGDRGKDTETLVAEARQALQELEVNRTAYEKHLEKLDVASRETASDKFDVTMLQSDMQSYIMMIDRVVVKLQQLNYDAKGDAKVSTWNEAKSPLMPASDQRLKLLLASPAGVLAALVGVFMLLEVRGGRVATAEELTSRSKVEVLGVLPPLPGPRPMQGLKATREHGDRVEEFVQSLDHLRVTLCGGATTEAGRVVLITSAVGGEGKTTLAVQLAARCANAGVSTLLIDADLRRAALGRLLEVGEGASGLSDVLRGDLDVGNAMVVVGQAGGFHLLPAGSPGHDPSRVLQGKPLGHLLARLRKAFDVIIIDTPPVLPVPDALTLGRWADGAVLAVRRDNSRFPLVEQANRRLLAAGIPVLGAVLNGLRPTMAAYGSYAYSGRRQSPAEESA